MISLMFRKIQGTSFVTRRRVSLKLPRLKAEGVSRDGGATQDDTLWEVCTSLSMTCFMFLIPLISHAQETPADVLPLQAVISGPSEVQVGKTVVLDTSLSVVDAETARYQWTMDGRVISTNEEAVLTLDKAGRYAVALRIRDNPGTNPREASVAKEILVYEKKIVLVAGPTVEREKLEFHQKSGEEIGVFLDILHAQDISIPLGIEDALTKLIVENAEKLRGADTVVLWADGAIAMNALSRALRQKEEFLSLVSQQTIILITDRGLQRLGRIIRGPFAGIQPKQIIITRKEAINFLIGSPDIESFSAAIAKADIDSHAVDRATYAIRPWNVLSTLVSYMVSRGVSSEMIILLLMLPIILAIITFLKQVVGVTTFGLYTPAVITLSFIALGWKIGLVLLLIILVAGYATRALIGSYRILYIPKIAIILTVTSLVLLLVLAAAAAFGITLAPDTIFILLIMTTLGEEFMSVKAEMGLRSALLAVAETLGVSLVCFAIVQWDAFKSIVLAYPEIILLTLVANIFMGRWTGLRLSEVVRFKEIFKYLEE